MRSRAAANGRSRFESRQHPRRKAALPRGRDDGRRQATLLPGAASAASICRASAPRRQPSPPPYGGIGSEIEVWARRRPSGGTRCFSCAARATSHSRPAALRGRLLTDVEVNAARRVAVVNQTLVNKFWTGGSLGQRIRVKFLETMPTAPVKTPCSRSWGHRRRRRIVAYRTRRGRNVHSLHDDRCVRTGHSRADRR
jgi:hypothetical protein